MIAAGISTASVARLPDITDCNYIVIHMSSIQQQVRAIIINPHNITGTQEQVISLNPQEMLSDKGNVEMRYLKFLVFTF